MRREIQEYTPAAPAGAAVGLTVEALERHRPALMGHCYRMLGSVVDADDAVQETLVRAWRALERFEGRSSVRTWLMRIATRVCLDALADRKRRARPCEEGPCGTVDDALVAFERNHWLEPVPDALIVPPEADPHERLVAQQNVRMAFVAALQQLPARQRAALLLTEVIGCSAQEAAETLETSVASVNSAIQRARSTLGSVSAAPAPLSERQATLLERFVEAFERYDVAAITTLLRDDVVFSMPPFSLWLQGPQPVAQWMLGRGAACRGSRLVATAACGQPAFGQYKPHADGDLHAWSLTVLELDAERVAAWTSFLDVETLFPRFGLPLTMPAQICDSTGE